MEKQHSVGDIYVHGTRLQTCPAFGDEFDLNNKFCLTAFENYYFVKKLDTSNHIQMHGCMDPWNTCANIT